MDARPRAALSQVAAAVSAASCWGVKLGMNGQTAVSPLGDFGVAVPKQCYLLSQRGQDAVSFGFRTSFILAPQDGHSKLVRVFSGSLVPSEGAQTHRCFRPPIKNGTGTAVNRNW